jgi:hypothetical protein
MTSLSKIRVNSLRVFGFRRRETLRANMINLHRLLG